MIFNRRIQVQIQYTKFCVDLRNNSQKLIITSIVFKCARIHQLDFDPTENIGSDGASGGGKTLGCTLTIVSH